MYCALLVEIKKWYTFALSLPHSVNATLSIVVPISTFIFVMELIFVTLCFSMHKRIEENQQAVVIVRWSTAWTGTKPGQENSRSLFMFGPVAGIVPTLI